MKRLLAVVALCLCCGLAAAQVRGLPDFSELAERQGPAVVNIGTSQLARSQALPLPFDENDPAFELFKRFFPRQPGAGGTPREFESKSLGSGFIISADGYILTNAHVVDGADEVSVRLTDKREFKARLVGADKRTDVALLKIDAAGLPVVKLGDPTRLKVGEWVVAIGSPFGFDNSVTAGIVSAKGRALPQENYVPFIQTDVAINPGNSGGPLFNLNGEVVGINSQIYSRSGGYMGVSFAIPIDVAMEIQQQLRSTGKVSRGRLGVVIQEVSKELAESLGLARPMGAVVNAIEPDGPAQKAGIAAGDVILRFDGKTVNSSAELPRLVAATRPGTRALVQVWRQGKLREIAVTVGQMVDERAEPARPERKGRAQPQAANRLGLVVAELAPEKRRELGVDGGLLVEEVRSAGARAELRPGDVLLALISRGSATELKSVEQFSRLLGQFDRNANITLLIRRGDLQTFVTIRGSNANH
ncbi:serine protease Do [Azonexus fungiphilus]|uniref:Probable periplasmic serine endoprotease DegP-like n=1 Tax=Azonexus fungiphilus TaxID=146940 RepID=A0A495WIG3_9RHOO|nr:DegQ family serine endoprotease [Azonexus fungiphilus]RKT60525.1 serine protease Do [Azonexus fungiphilus]